MNGIKQFRKNKQGFLLVDAMIGVLVVVCLMITLKISHRQLQMGFWTHWKVMG